MNRIQSAFQNGKAFIPFITCGDPDLQTTKRCVEEMVKAGADLIEFGIPFSDPTAEGPVIQAANKRALDNGVTTDDVFAMVKELRNTIDIPFAFMTYSNVVFSYKAFDNKERKPDNSREETLCNWEDYDSIEHTPDKSSTEIPFNRGAERFLEKCRESGIDALILPDLPYEEKGEFLPYCRKAGIALVSLVAPTSKERIGMIAKEAEGFLYIVSSLGVTGTRSEITTDLKSIVDVVRQNTDIPCAIGFGISTPEQAHSMAQLADGAIVGSAIVKLIEEHKTKAPEIVGEYVRSMKNAI